MGIVDAEFLETRREGGRARGLRKQAFSGTERNVEPAQN